MRKQIIYITTCIAISGCIPAAPVNIKRIVTAPPYDSECAREAVKAVEGVRGVVVNRMDDKKIEYQILVESSYGVDTIQLYGNPEKKLVLSGAAWTKEGASSTELTRRTNMVNKLLDAVQSKCGAQGAQQGAQVGRLRRRLA